MFHARLGLRSVFFAVLLLTTCHVTAIFAADATPPKLRDGTKVLILLSGDFGPGGKVIERLDALKASGGGYEVKQIGDPALGAAYLRGFQTVVLADFTGLQTPFFTPREILQKHLQARRAVRLLRSYVEQGGGLIVSPIMAGGGQEVSEGCEELLGDWGLTVLTAGVRDDGHQGIDKHYSWTTAIERTPVTERVNTIWYPTNQLRWDDAYATVPAAITDKAWRALVRGMEGSVAAKGLQYKDWKPIPNTPSPAIVAAREVGKGRVVYLGVGGFYHFLHGDVKVSNGWIGESMTGPVDSIFLEKGDGQTSSDGWRLIVNAINWTAGNSAAQSADVGEEKGGPIPIPAWLTWREGNGGKWFKVFIGARSNLSDGTSTIAELADTARAAGVGVLILTETFEKLSADRWPDVVEACRKASVDGLVVLPGIDIADAYQNRFLIFGQKTYPEPFMLDAGGKVLAQAQYASLGFGNHFTAIHRPTSSPLPVELQKFFAGVVVYTYRKGKVVDDGLAAYEWQVNNASMPLPLAVHETYSADELRAEAGEGHHLFVMADTLPNAVWYMRNGMAHFWECPPQYMISSGPMIDTLGDSRAVVRGEEAISTVRLRCRGFDERVWTPAAKTADLDLRLTPSHLRWMYLHVTDAKGRTAISPPFYAGPGARYSFRCSDRQNTFGYAAQYQGAVLPDIELSAPVFETIEGRGLWPSQGGPRRGENLAALLDYSFSSPAVTITDARIDQRYWRALWEDVVFDAKSSQGTSRSRVFDATARYYDFGLSEAWRQHDNRRPMMIKEISLRMRTPAAADNPIYPQVTTVSATPSFSIIDPATGAERTGKLEQGFLDIPVGGVVDDLIALAPGLRTDARGRVGLAAEFPAGSPFPIGHVWSAMFVKAPSKDKAVETAAAMGLRGVSPYSLELTRGKLTRLAYAAWLAPEQFGIAGVVKPAQAMPYKLPLFVDGLNARWPAGLWRADGSLVFIGVHERRGYASLDVTAPGEFFVGHLVTCDQPQLGIMIHKWDETSATLYVNNTGPREVETKLASPAEIKGRLRIDHAVKIAGGAGVVIELK